MDKSLENNPRYPANNADPAKIAHYNLKINNKQDWDDAVFLVKEKIQELELAVEKLKAFAFQVQIEHEHSQNK
jgi:hypothetical protein